MDTLVAVQKLFRLRALIQDSPLSSGDVFVEPTKQPHAVVQSPVIELTPQDIHISPSWASPAKSVHSTSKEPIPQATIPIPKAFLRTLSRYSSPRPSQMLRSCSNCEPRTEKDDMLTCRRERRASVVTSTGLANYTGPKTIWTDHDSFLPRAKPPPPLKCIKHARKRSKDNVSPPDPTVPSQRPSTSYYRSSEQSSESHSTASRSPQQSLDVPTLEMSSEDSNQPAADIQHTLERTTTRTTIASKASDDTEITFAPSNCDWNPPTSWAGPSKAASADEDDGPKPVGWFARRKSAHSSKRSSMQVPVRLIYARSLRKLKPVHLADTEEPEEEGDSVTRGGPLSSGVVVKIQCYENNRWHEKPMADIIPKLRELKFK